MYAMSVQYIMYVMMYEFRSYIEIRHRVKKHPQSICSDLRLSN